jgi:FkbM family methyltransferase
LGPFVRRSPTLSRAAAATGHAARQLRLLTHVSKRELLSGRLTLDLEGFSLEVPRDMAWAFSTGAYYETNVDHWFVRAFENLERPVVYDIGANCGFYTLRAAAAGARVVAVEPTSSTFAALERNIARNAFRDATALRLALGDRVGTTRITLFSSSGNNSSVARRPESVAHLRVTGIEEVELTTLDELTTTWELPLPDILKIDAEGSDFAVLRGGARTLSESHPVILLEHAEESCDAGYTLEDVRAFLAELGYRLHLLADPFASAADDLTLHPIHESVEAFGTVLAVPPGSAL